MANLGKKAEARVADMVANTAVPFVVSNPRLYDNPIIMCNAAFTQLTGYNESEIIGSNCRFLAGKDTRPEHTQLIVNAVRNQDPVMVQILNYKRNGTPFQNALMIAPMFDEAGELAYFLGSQMEIVDTSLRAMPARQRLAMARIKLLSPQQKRVLIYVAKGYMNKQIAHSLQISESTVKMHRAEAFTKIGVSTTAEAIRIAVEAGL